MAVSFDFDGTLSREDVQEYARDLIDKGIEVLVVTSRYDEDNKHLYPANPTNEDLYEVTDKLGIPRENIHFMNMELKADFLKEKKNVDWHLDDDEIEVDEINKIGGFISGIHMGSDWQWRCDFIISAGF